MRFYVNELMKVGRLLFMEGLVDARAGNMSIRIGEKLLITRRGSHLGMLREEDFILVSLDRKDPLEDRASSELIVHREIYTKTRWKAVVHAHPPNVVKLSFEKDTIEPVDSEGISLLGSVKVIPDYPSGSKELAVVVSDVLKKDNLVVVRGHGVFSADVRALYAYSHISVLEHSCKILLL